MNYTIEAFNETWGNHEPMQEPVTVSTYADVKWFICASIEETVQTLYRRYGQIDMRIRTVDEIHGEKYSAVMEWCPDGELVPEDDSQWRADANYGIQVAVFIQGYADAGEK